MKRLYLCLLLVLTVTFAACGAPDTYVSQSYFAMDTLSEVRIYGVEDGAAAFSAAGERLRELDKMLSVSAEGGEVYTFNHSETGLTVASPELLSLVETAERFTAATDGAFDICAGALAALWKTCAEQNRMPAEEELRQATAMTDADLVQEGHGLQKQEAGLVLDFGAIGKGFAADCLKETLLDAGVSCAMISFVSSVTVFGDREFRIAIRTPDDSGSIAGELTLKNASLAVSGNYERGLVIDGRHYDHIIDPHTGYPVDNGVDSVVVVTDNGALADALSTALTVMGPGGAWPLYQSGDLNFEAAMFYNGRWLVTDGFANMFQTADADIDIMLLSEFQ